MRYANYKSNYLCLYTQTHTCINTPRHACIHLGRTASTSQHCKSLLMFLPLRKPVLWWLHPFYRKRLIFFVAVFNLLVVKSSPSTSTATYRVRLELQQKQILHSFIYIHIYMYICKACAIIDIKCSHPARCIWIFRLCSSPSIFWHMIEKAIQSSMMILFKQMVNRDFFYEKW